MNIPTNTLRVATLGNRLRTARPAKGLTQQQLAQQAGTNQAVIQKIANGKSERPRGIIQIARALSVNPAWLQFGEPYAAQRIPDRGQAA